jgi:GMP synthase-like glutamine amidotransferase
MPKLLISRHIECEGPGYLGEVLDRNGVDSHIVRIDQGETLPRNPEGYAGLVFMGGPMSVNDDLPWIPAALNLIRGARERDLPVLGHCLGGQLIARALGAEVSANPVKEIGWLPVTPCAPDQPWTRDLPARFEAFHWHGETFALPAGATRLLASEHCANQAFAIGSILALQCHIEMTADMVREWAALYRHEIESPTATVQDLEQMCERIEQRVSSLQRIAGQLYTRWLEPVLREA